MNYYRLLWTNTPPPASARGERSRVSHQWHRRLDLFLLIGVFLVLSGCGNDDASAIPTPDVKLLAPTATSLAARVEVVIVVVTPTAEPTSTPTPQPEGGQTAEQGDEQSGGDAGSDSAPGDAANGAQGAATAAPMSNQQLINMGEDVYGTECASCHQLNGEGTSTYPALNGSGVLDSGDPTSAIQIVLYGRGEMPAFEDTLSNEQIAAVLSYERNAWQNDASVVKVAQVRQMRRGESSSAGQPTTIGTTTAATTMAATGTVTATQTVTATDETATTATQTASPAAPTVAATDAPSATVAADTEQGATQPPLTWTPARQVTPLLPTTSASNADDTRTPAVEAATPALTKAPSPQATGEPTSTVETPEPTTISQPSASQPSASQQDEQVQAMLRQGEEVYAAECASCHELNGEGTSVYPALNGSDMLTAEDPTQAIQIVLNGQGEMPAFADILSTGEIAAVLSHERNAWDNSASMVTVEQVEDVQAESGGETGGE